KKGGEDVSIISRGLGSLSLSDGTLSIYDSPTPLDTLRQLPDSHPYSKLSEQALTSGIDAFTSHIPCEGSLERSVLLPTALGTLRHASFFPASYAAGIYDDDERESAPYLLVGFSGLKDFYPALAAGNLERQGLRARSHMLDLAFAGGETALNFSRQLDKNTAAEELGELLGALAREGERIGIPAVLRSKAFERCANAAGVPPFQIPLAPPSVVGMEWNDILVQACRDARIDIHLNARAVGARTSGGRIDALRVEIAGTTRDIPCDNVVYAAGGLESGAIERDSYGTLSETVFDLPIYTGQSGAPVTDTSQIVNPDYWADDQPIFTCGLAVDEHMRPIGEDGKPAWENLYAAGSMLAGAQRAREKSGEGIALASAAAAAQSILEEAR
ncbi:MAG: FAD-binding protein, partial [Actinomycetaceae bacterium]|nr:FAD-binding protein [Actinomycetaceae bacterium]